MKYKSGEKVTVNSGGADSNGIIKASPNPKATKGIYWKEQDCWRVEFDNGTAQYMPAKYIRKATGYDYYRQQLGMVDIDRRYLPKLQILGKGDSKTHWMDLNSEAVTAIIRWLKENFAASEDRYVILNNDDIMFIGTYKECDDYMLGNEGITAEIAMERKDWDVRQIDIYLNVPK